MPKRKQQPNQNLIKSLEQLISDHDRPTLVRALGALKSDLGWQILRSALMKNYLNHASIALDHAAKTGQQLEAAFEAGVARNSHDTATTIIDAYIYLLEERIGAIQSERPEE